MLIVYLSMIDSDQERKKMTEIYEEHKYALLHYAMNIIKNQSMAEDAVHNAFISIIENKEKYFNLDCRDFRRSAVVIVRHKCIDILRKQKPFSNKSIEELEIFLESDEIPVDDQISFLSEYELIRKHMNSKVKGGIYKMNDKYDNFNEKRMHIFGEIVKRYWKGKIQNLSDLDVLADEISEKYGFSDSDMPFIKDHIRIAMGLNPNGKKTFNNELDAVKDSKGISLPVVAKVDGPCERCIKEHCECMEVGKYETEMYIRNDDSIISNKEAINCGYHIPECDFGALVDKIEFMPVVNLLKDEKTPVYATVAPAIIGQFGDNVSMGKLRTALKQLGFEDVIEVALFADILTMKEAFEFNQLVKNEEDFFLTSCCCPIWFNMVKKSYPEIYKYMSPSVSPMIASGRILKELYKGAKVVFIAPCIAKKAEIKDPDLVGAIDFVLNFRELKEIFDVLEIDLEGLQGDEKDQGSLGGRLYARTGGVSFSVKTVVNRLEPSRVIKLKPNKVNGVKECKEVLEDLKNGKKMNANFIEGMGCVGGCVGGPRTNIDKDKATKYVNDFGEDSYILTPFDNLNAMKILELFGINSIEEIIENEKMNRILTRE